MIYVILADGFEEIEAFGTIDILRRCGFGVETLSCTGRRVVQSARGITVKADSLFRKSQLKNIEAIILPGGLKCAETMANHSLLLSSLRQLAADHVLIAAICAAPMALGAAHILQGIHATIYPGMQQHIPGAIYHNDAFVVQHENFITAAGPAATQHFAFAIARRLSHRPATIEEVEQGMLFKGYYQGETPLLKCQS